jgi:hypothetical protein
MPPGRGICPSQRLHLHRTTETHINSAKQPCQSGIRTHDPRVRAIGNRTQPRSRGQFVRRYVTYSAEKHPKWTKQNNATIRQKPLLDHLVKDNLKQIDVNTGSRAHVYTDGADSIGILAQTQTGFGAKQAAVERSLLSEWHQTNLDALVLHMKASHIPGNTSDRQTHKSWEIPLICDITAEGVQIKATILTLPIRQTHDMRGLK